MSQSKHSCRDIADNCYVLMYVYVLVRLVSILCASTKKTTVLQSFASFTQPLDRKKIRWPWVLSASLLVRAEPLLEHCTIAFASLSAAPAKAADGWARNLVGPVRSRLGQGGAGGIQRDGPSKAANGTPPSGPETHSMFSEAGLRKCS